MHIKRFILLIIIASGSPLGEVTLAQSCTRLEVLEVLSDLENEMRILGNLVLPRPAVGEAFVPSRGEGRFVRSQVRFQFIKDRLPHILDIVSRSSGNRFMENDQARSALLRLKDPMKNLRKLMIIERHVTDPEQEYWVNRIDEVLRVLEREVDTAEQQARDEGLW